MFHKSVHLLAYSDNIENITRCKRQEEESAKMGLAVSESKNSPTNMGRRLEFFVVADRAGRLREEFALALVNASQDVHFASFLIRCGNMSQILRFPLEQLTYSAPP